MTTSPAAPLHVYRSLLKAVDKHLTSIAGNKQWREYVQQEFRANANLKNSVVVSQQLGLAVDYCTMINNIAHHKVTEW